MRFKIGSSCSCGNLNRLKALYNAGFSLCGSSSSSYFEFLKKDRIYTINDLQCFSKNKYKENSKLNLNP